MVNMYFTSRVPVGDSHISPLELVDSSRDADTLTQDLLGRQPPRRHGSPCPTLNSRRSLRGLLGSRTACQSRVEYGSVSSTSVSYDNCPCILDTTG